MMRRDLFTCFALSTALTAGSAEAWLLPEHDRIGADAIQLLTPEARQTLQSAWALATQSRPSPARYCEQVGQAISSDSVIDDGRWCVGFSSFAALAGDHACIPGDVQAVVESASWTGPLLVNARNLSAHMATLNHPGTDLDRVSAWRDHNLALQEIDRDLFVRARSNAAHFAPPLDRTLLEPEGARYASDLGAFIARALLAGGSLNVVASYAHYHSAALWHAARAAEGCEAEDGALSCSPAAIEQLWKALLAEAFALHFLEDAFSAGHIVGSWGDVGQRLGTHDAYSARGLDVRTWAGSAYVAHGDAFLTDEDDAHAAAAVAQSLTQLGAAFHGQSGGPAAGAPPTLSVCDPAVTTPKELSAAAQEPELAEVIRQLPIASSRGHGAVRVRSEVGPFFTLSLDGSGIAMLRRDGAGLGYSDARLRVAIGPGMGLEGAFSRFMDGQLFLELMLVTSMHEFALGRPAIGFGFRIRMPFAYVPGDLLFVVAPAALFGSEWAYRLARQAVAGGIGRLERLVILTESLSAQLMLGREATVSWLPEFGWLLEVPIAQLRSDHSFSGAFATESVLQLGAAFHWGAAPVSDPIQLGLFVTYTYRSRRFVPQD